MDIVSQRQRLEGELADAQKRVLAAKNWESHINGLIRELQRSCPHENVTEGSTWQGGGRYYTMTKCHDCGKTGDRYRPDLTRKEYQDKEGNYIYSDRQEDYFIQEDEYEREFDSRRVWTTAADRRREEAEAISKLTPEMKHWFGQGEADVDAMLAAGAVTALQILNAWNNERASEERGSRP